LIEFQPIRDEHGIKKCQPVVLPLDCRCLSLFRLPFFISLVNQRSYTIAKKRDVIEVAMTSGVRPTARKFGIPRATVCDWVLNQDKISAFSGSEKKKTTQGQGRPELIPFARELVTYMKDVRRENEVRATSFGLVLLGFALF